MTYLNTKQLADRWGLKEVTIRKWRSLNRGPKWVTIGSGKNSVFYKLQDIKRFEKNNIQSVKTIDGTMKIIK